MDNKDILGLAKLIQTPLGSIDPADAFFALSSPDGTAVEALARSIAAHGLAEPLLLQAATGSRRRIVHGFRRFEAARRCGLTVVPALVFPGETEALALFRLRLTGHEDRLAAVEASKVLDRLGCLPGADESRLIAFLPLFGLPEQPRAMDELRSLRRLEEPVARWCIETKAGLAEAAQIAALPRESQRGLLVLLRAVNPGGNILRRYLALMREISLREGKPVEAVLADREIRRVLLDPQTARSAGRELVHRRLRELRYPELSALEARFRESLRSLGLPERVKIEPPESFEGERLKLSYEFGSAEELKDMAERLGRAAGSGSISELFECLGAPRPEDLSDPDEPEA